MVANLAFVDLAERQLGRPATVGAGQASVRAYQLKPNGLATGATPIQRLDQVCPSEGDHPHAAGVVVGPHIGT